MKHRYGARKAEKVPGLLFAAETGIRSGTPSYSSHHPHRSDSPWNERSSPVTFEGDATAWKFDYETRRPSGRTVDDQHRFIYPIGCSIGERDGKVVPTVLWGLTYDGAHDKVIRRMWGEKGQL